MSWKKHNILRTKAEVEALDKYLMTDGKPNFELISVDTETNGLHFWKNVVIGISFSVDSDNGFYIPFLEWTPIKESQKQITANKEKILAYMDGYFTCVWTKARYPEEVTPDEYKAPQWILDYIEKWLTHENIRLIMHNAPFDSNVIRKSLGFDPKDFIFCDTQLLKHIIDENTSCGLKQTAMLWQKELGIPVEKEANEEQKAMKASILENGGKWGKKEKTIWRADPDLLGYYACADTFLTFGLFEVGIKKLEQDYEPKHFDWFFEDEVMPLCREVVIDMKWDGIRINVPYFTEMEKETKEVLSKLEDTIIRILDPYLDSFTIGKSVDEEVSKKALIERIIELEGLEYPTKTIKGETKKSLAKPVIKKAYEKDPHWLWGYILGDDELKYSDEKLEAIKNELYHKRVGRRYRFNIGSDQHLRWLFCEKLGYDKTKLPQTDSARPREKKYIPSMKAEVLKEYMLKEHPRIVKPLLLFKKLRKLYSTYIIPALELHNNGLLHMDFLQHGTISGRFSCAGGYNLQTLPQVEELDKCPKCGSKNVSVEQPIKVLANMTCSDCGHTEADILCPSAIKDGFLAPDWGNIVNADYSSLEPRCFSFMSGDPKLKAIYLENLDMYSKVYCDMEDHEGKYSPDPKAENFLKKAAKHLRNMVKPVVLGIPYGARAPQTANLMGFKKTIVNKQGQEIEILDINRGAEFREKYLNTYPELRKYMDKMETMAVTKGFVETIVGRRRHFKFTRPVYDLICAAGMSIDDFLDIKRKDFSTRRFNDIFCKENFEALSEICGFDMVDQKSGIPRDWNFVRAMFKNELNNAKNFPIQGLAAHITNRAMIDINRIYKESGIKARLVLNVHDEISSYAGFECTEDAVEITRICMEENIYAKKVDIPMIADPLIAQTLKDAK